jgi:hypothetical protein
LPPAELHQLATIAMSPPPLHQLAPLVSAPDGTGHVIVVGLELEGEFKDRSFGRSQLCRALTAALTGFPAPRCELATSGNAVSRSRTPLRVVDCKPDGRSAARTPCIFSAKDARDAVCVKEEIASISPSSGSHQQTFEEITLPAVPVPQAKQILSAVIPVISPLMQVNPEIQSLQVNVGLADGNNDLVPISPEVLVNVAKMTALTAVLVDFIHHCKRVKPISQVLAERLRKKTVYSGPNWGSKPLLDVLEKSASWSQALRSAFEVIGKCFHQHDLCRTSRDLYSAMNHIAMPNGHCDKLFDVSFYKVYCNADPDNYMDAPGPVEFRQHCGTFNQQEVEDWIDLVVAIFSYARTHTKKQVDALKHSVLPDVLNASAAKVMLRQLLRLPQDQVDRMVDKHGKVRVPEVQGINGLQARKVGGAPSGPR